MAVVRRAVASKAVASMAVARMAADGMAGGTVATVASAMLARLAMATMATVATVATAAMVATAVRRMQAGRHRPWPKLTLSRLGHLLRRCSMRGRALPLRGSSSTAATISNAASAAAVPIAASLTTERPVFSCRLAIRDGHAGDALASE